MNPLEKVTADMTAEKLVTVTPEMMVGQTVRDRACGRGRGQERAVRGRASDGGRKIGEGTHGRGVLDVAKFERRFGATKPAVEMASTCGRRTARSRLRAF